MTQSTAVAYELRRSPHPAPNQPNEPIHAALAYYHANQEEIEQDIADEAVAADQLEREHTKILD